MSRYGGQGRQRKRSAWFSSEEYHLSDMDETGEDKGVEADVQVQNLAFVNDQNDDNNCRTCAVCSDTASGYHYKCLTCEGCKGFFRRTVQKKLAGTYVCRAGNNKCVINPRNRGRCQACRYAKCVMEGMVEDLVMTAEERLAKRQLINGNRKRRRDSNVGHDDDDYEDDSSTTTDSSIEVVRVVGPGEDYEAAILKAYFECYQSEERHSMTSPWPVVTNFLSLVGDIWIRNSEKPFAKFTTLHLIRTANFIDMIPEIKDLPVSDKMQLLGNCGLKVLLFNAARNMGPTSGEFFDCPTVEKDCAFVYLNMRYFRFFLPRQDFDETELALFAAMLMCQSDESKNLSNPNLVDEVNTKLENSIMERAMRTRAHERHQDDLMFGNCTLYLRVKTLFRSVHPLLELDDVRPDSKDLLRYFN